MAKVKFGGIVQDARGKIDGVVYAKNQYGAYVRVKVAPVQPGTPRQTLVRERLSTLSKRFSTIITQAQRDAWNAFGKVNPVVDVFGNVQSLTGVASYVRLNGTILNGGGTIIDTPPADLAVTGLLSLTATGRGAGSAIAATGGNVTANVLTLNFASHPFVVGQQISLSGFTGAGAPLNGQTVTIATTTATSITAPFTNPDIASVGTGTAMSLSFLSLAFTATPLLANTRLYIYASVGKSAGVQFFIPDLRFIGVSGDAQTSPYNVTADYVAKFGAMVVGRAIGVNVGVCDTTKGACTPGIFARVVLT